MSGGKRHQPHPGAQLQPHSSPVIWFYRSGGGMHTLKRMPPRMVEMSGFEQSPGALLSELLVRGVEKTALIDEHNTMIML